MYIWPLCEKIYVTQAAPNPNTSVGVERKTFGVTMNLTVLCFGDGTNVNDIKFVAWVGVLPIVALEPARVTHDVDELRRKHN